MVHLHRPHTIHEDYAAKRAVHRVPGTSLRALCVASAFSVALAYGFARASSTRAEAPKTPPPRRFPKHEEVWRPTWDRGSTRKHVNNLWNDPAKTREG
jgi:hypothetical protein